MSNSYNNNILIKKLNIVKIINDYVKLENCGNNFRGFSPFKKENTPSFMVSPKKNIWKDFSSGKGGNLVKFIMEFFNYNYKEAINYLINKYIYKKKFLNSKNTLINKFENNFLTNVNKNISYINSIYKKKLLKNKLALNYLLNRGLNTKTIKKFNIGYSPNNISIIDILKKKNKKLNNKLLKNLGLFTIINNNFYYLFKNRIMFPIKDISGNIIGFGGRILSLLINKNKYINSTNNLIFNKSKIFYGLYENINYISKKDYLYIVEGYLDLLSLYNVNIKNVVSSLGTNISKYHINLILKYTKVKEVIFLYDGDETGIDGAIKNINCFLDNNINIRFFFFKNNEDPCSFIKKNKNKLRNKDYYFLKKSLDIIDFFKIKYLSYRKDNYLKDPFLKLIFLKKILEKIVLINNFIIKEFYIQKIVKVFKIKKEYIYKEINKISQNKVYKPKKIKPSKKLKKTKTKVININKNILFYKKKIFLFLKKYNKRKNNKFIFNPEIFKFFLKLLNKYKISFKNKKYNYFIKKIKKFIKLNKITIQNPNFVNSSNKKYKYIIKEILLKYKYYNLLKTLNIYINKIKYKKNKTQNFFKFYFLIKEKNKILNKLYHL